VTAVFSIKEAAAIAGVSEPSVRKAIENETLRPRAVPAGRAPRYRFGVRDMLYLKLVVGFPLVLDRRDKAALRRLVECRRSAAGRWRVSGGDFVMRAGDVTVHVEVQPVRDALARSLLAYRRGRRRVDRDPAILGGEPVFEGTRVPLAQVAALIAKGVPADEIAEDYPALSRDDLAFAAIHARMRRDPGRPRKALEFTRGGGVARPVSGTARGRGEAAHR
jgi:uncharacterized protein (DUF433 family)